MCYMKVMDYQPAQEGQKQKSSPDLIYLYTTKTIDFQTRRSILSYCGDRPIHAASEGGVAPLKRGLRQVWWW